MSDDGFVVLWRKAMDSREFSEDATWRLFCYCIMRAKWKRTAFRGRWIERGQFGMVASEVANDLKWDRSKLNRTLSKLVEMGSISYAGVNNRWTLVTVCNYNTYQDVMGQDRTTTEQPANNRRTTSEQPANNQRTTQEINKGTTEPLEQLEQGKKKLRGGFDPLQVELPEELDNEVFRAAWGEWFEYRRQRRLAAYTEMTTAKQLKKLAQMGVNAAIAAIEHSIAESYQGIFEPKQNGRAPKPKVSTRI